MSAPVASCVFLGLTLASSVAWADDHEPDPEAETGWFAGQRGFSAKLDTGLAYRQVHSFPALGANFDLSFGAQTRAGGWYGMIGGLLGSTLGGINMRQFRVGASWEVPIERLHLGLGPSLSYLQFQRVSIDGVIDSFGGGPFAFASYDLHAGDSGALALSLKGSADIYDGGVLYGATLGLGGRLY